MAQQTIDIGSAPNDGTGDPIRDAFDKCNDNFTELYGEVDESLEFKGSTNCSANPNYPAAEVGDAYLVSHAGKIGGASGTVVSIGDIYFATVDNAGGTQAAVGSSWTVLTGGGGGSALDDLDDVNAPSPSNGDVLTWDSTPGEWVAAAGGGVGAFDLDDATDVDTTGAAAGHALMYNGTNWISAGGTSFPGSPATGQRFYRTDRNIEYFYDGTQWLSTQLFSIGFLSVNAVTVDTAAYAPVPYQGVYSIYLERIESVQFRTATGEWDVVFDRTNSANTNTTIVTLDGSGVATNTWTTLSATIGAVLDSSARALRLTYDEISGSASVYGNGTLWYRLVG